MKALIIGSSGQIGENLFKVFQKNHEVEGVDIEPLRGYFIKADMTDTAAIRNILRGFSPDVVLLPAAYPHVDGCEMNPSACECVNVTAPRDIASFAAERGIKFVYFSSDYIFNGESGPYDEEDKADPLSVYGKQKLKTEEFIAKNLDDYLVIRTTTVYGPEIRGKNFVLSLTKRIMAGENIKIPVDQVSTPTYSPDLAEAVAKLVESDAKGIFNVAGPILMNRMEFAKLICEIFELNSSRLVPVKTAELNQKAKRPLKGGLKIGKLLSTIKVEMRPPAEGLLELRRLLV